MEFLLLPRSGESSITEQRTATMISRFSLQITIGVLVLINIVLVVVLFQRSSAHPEHPLPPGGPRKMMEQRMQFDAQQSAKFDVLIKEHQAALKMVRDSITFHRKALSALLKLPAQDSVAVNDHTRRIGTLQTQLELINHEHFREVRALCTSEQLPAFNNLIEEVSGIISHSPPPHGPHGGPPHGH
jgi:periplasmic protein CpxP/Spy